MKLARWTMLAVGVSMASLFAIAFALVATGMQRFGGIPWSWGLLRLNAGWAALLLCGLLLLGIAPRLFLRERLRSNTN